MTMMVGGGSNACAVQGTVLSYPILVLVWSWVARLEGADMDGMDGLAVWIGVYPRLVRSGICLLVFVGVQFYAYTR